jgi:hypothetical protein
MHACLRPLLSNGPRSTINSQQWKRLLTTVAKQRMDKQATMCSPCNSGGILGGVFFGVRSRAIYFRVTGAVG